MAKHFTYGFHKHPVLFGISRRRVASFEEHVKKLIGNEGLIDLF